MVTAIFVLSLCVFVLGVGMLQMRDTLDARKAREATLEADMTRYRDWWVDAAKDMREWRDRACDMAAKLDRQKLKPFGSAKTCPKCGAAIPKHFPNGVVVTACTMHRSPQYHDGLICRRCPQCGWEVNELPLDARG